MRSIIVALNANTVINFSYASRMFLRRASNGCFADIRINNVCYSWTGNPQEATIFSGGQLDSVVKTLRQEYPTLTLSIE